MGLCRDAMARGRRRSDRLAGMASEIPSQRKRIRKAPEERRREILDAAVRLISERGYNGISIQDVADAVGVDA